jgi:hypothetical protein
MPTHAVTSGPWHREVSHQCTHRNDATHPPREPGNQPLPFPIADGERMQSPEELCCQYAAPAPAPSTISTALMTTTTASRSVDAQQCCTSQQYRNTISNPNYLPSQMRCASRPPPCSLRPPTCSPPVVLHRPPLQHASHRTHRSPPAEPVTQTTLVSPSLPT